MPNQLFCLRLSVYLLTIVIYGVCFDPTIDRLPHNEHEAEKMVAHHILDSMTWQRLEPFYKRPLLIPYGELVLLHDIFPELITSLPAENEILTTYFPWDSVQIARFLTAYPVVARFEPVVSFSVAKSYSHGELSAILHHRSGGVSSVNMLRAAMHIGKKMQFGGTIDATSDFVRWDRRQITVAPSSGITITAGNKPLFPDKGLVYGVFPVDSNSIKNISDNWLYGTTPTWNGTSCRVTSPFTAVDGAVQFFAHYRPAEIIYGGLGSVKINKHTGGWCGITSITDKFDESHHHYFHTQLSLDISGIHSELISATSMRRHLPTTYLWENRLATERQSAVVKVLHFPLSFDASRSMLLRRSLHVVNDTILNAAVTMATTSLRYQMGLGITCGTDAQVWWYGGIPRHASVALCAERQGEPFTYEIDVRSELESMTIPPAYTFEGVISWNATRRLTVLSSPQLRCSPLGSTQLRWLIRSTFIPAAYSFISPGINVQIDNGSLREVYGEYHQKIVLFERTFTEVTVEKGIRIDDKKQYYRVTAHASYFF